MTVLDSSVVFDFLVSDDPPNGLDQIIAAEGEAAAPDLLVFEVVAALRRQTLAGLLEPPRAMAAVGDLEDLAVELFSTMDLRRRAWQLRENMTVGDALFVALAELLEEPLCTRDRRLTKAVRDHTGVSLIEL